MDTSFRPETYFPSPPTLRHQLLCPSIVYEFHHGLQCEQPTVRKTLWCDLLLLRFKAHLTPVYSDTQGCFTIMLRTHDLHRSKASLRWVTEVFSNTVNGIAEHYFAFSIDYSVESFVVTAVLYTLWPASLFLPQFVNQWCFCVLSCRRTLVLPRQRSNPLQPTLLSLSRLIYLARITSLSRPAPCRTQLQ